VCLRIERDIVRGQIIEHTDRTESCQILSQGAASPRARRLGTPAVEWLMMSRSAHFCLLGANAYDPTRLWSYWIGSTFIRVAG